MRNKKIILQDKQDRSRGRINKMDYLGHPAARAILLILLKNDDICANQDLSQHVLVLSRR